MTSLNEQIWRLELVDHWLNLNRELADIYRQRYLRDEQIVTEAEQLGGPVWVYVDPTETARIAELHASLDAFREFGISG